MFSLLQKVCHGNSAISLVVQLFSSGTTQYLNQEILSSNVMYEGPSPNLPLLYTKPGLTSQVKPLIEKISCKCIDLWSI